MGILTLLCITIGFIIIIFNAFRCGQGQGQASILGAIFIIIPEMAFLNNYLEAVYTFLSFLGIIILTAVVFECNEKKETAALIGAALLFIGLFILK